MLRKWFLFIIFCSCHLNALSITEDQALLVADKIWQNECSKKKESLTCWNEGENFASMGIGHFIWYPSGVQEVFKQTFPSLITYLNTQNVTLPIWLRKGPVCPWKTREAFYIAIHTPQMNELRKFLYDTRKWQAFFMAQRLEQVLPGLLEKTPNDQKNQVKSVFYQLTEDPRGLYALLDYLNFKGEGTSTLESYEGQNWGLLQVLLAIPASSEHPIDDFILAAKQVLTQRVKNSPPARNEQRWLKGWLNRINTY